MLTFTDWKQRWCLRYRSKSTPRSSRNWRSSARGTAGALARELVLVEHTLRNWVKAAKKGELNLARAGREWAAEDGERDSKKGDGVLCQGCAVKSAWIDAHRKAYPLPAMCGILAVSGGGYRAWKRGGSPNRKRLTDARLLALIEALHKELKGACGSPRMGQDLRARGFSAAKPRGERLMRESGIRARHKRRCKATTESKHALPVAPNVLDRDFTPAASNRVWTGDITYIQTGEGWL